MGMATRTMVLPPVQISGVTSSSVAKAMPADQIIPMMDFNWLRLVSLLAVLVLVAPALLGRSRGSLVINALFWCGIILALVLAYGMFRPSVPTF